MSQIFQFDPILESITQFFRLKDCAIIAHLNNDYHRKTWLYILRSSSRLTKLNNVITINTQSWNWISKYPMHLKYVSFIVFSIIDYDLSVISECLSLTNFGCITSFPARVKKLTLRNFYSNFPKNTNIKTVNVSYDSNRNPLMTCPQSIQKLKIQDFSPFDCQRFPILPHLKKLYCRIDHMYNLHLLQEKCPNLAKLHLVTCPTLFDMKECSYFKHCLILDCHDLTTTEIFANFQCHELDLSNCPNIQNYSHVQHIPIVKKFSRKKNLHNI